MLLIHFFLTFVANFQNCAPIYNIYKCVLKITNNNKNKIIMKKLFLTQLFMLIAMLAGAEEYSGKVSIGKLDYYWYYDDNGYEEVTVRLSEDVTPSALTGKLEIHETVRCEGKTMNVTHIGDAAFENCTNITSVSIPKYVANIERNAFKGCSNLTDVYCYSLDASDIASGIANTAFDKAFNLHVYDLLKSDYQAAPWPSTYFTATLKADILAGAVGDYKFEIVDKDLKTAAIVGTTKAISGDVVLPSSVEILGENYTVQTIVDTPFRGNTAITSVTFPDSYVQINENEFRGCTSLASVTLGAGIEAISNEAFFGCKKLKKVVWNENITTIGRAAFYNCESLMISQLPAGAYIDQAAFYGCASLGPVLSIPATTTFDPNHGGVVGIFYDCTSITAFDIEEGQVAMRSVDGVIYNKDMTKILLFPHGRTGEFTFPNTVESINDDAFKTSKINTLIFPEGMSLTSIPSKTFSFCTGLTTIKFYKELNPIASNAFDGCNNISDIYLCGLEPTIKQGDTFPTAVESKATLHLMEGSYVYAKAKGWGGFVNYKEDLLAQNTAAPTVEYVNGKFIITSDEYPGVKVVHHPTITAVTSLGADGSLSVVGYNVVVFSTVDGWNPSSPVSYYFDIDPASAGADVNGDGVVDVNDAVKVIDVYVTTPAKK